MAKAVVMPKAGISDEVPSEYPIRAASQPGEGTSPLRPSSGGGHGAIAVPAASGSGGGGGAVPRSDVGAASPNADAAEPRTRVKASPRARALASRLGVDIAAATPTGPHGRVIVRDVEAVAARAKGAREASGMPGPAAAAQDAAKRDQGAHAPTELTPDDQPTATVPAPPTQPELAAQPAEPLQPAQPAQSAHPERGAAQPPQPERVAQPASTDAPTQPAQPANPERGAAQPPQPERVAKPAQPAPTYAPAQPTQPPHTERGTAPGYVDCPLPRLRLPMAEAAASPPRCAAQPMQRHVFDATQLLAFQAQIKAKGRLLSAFCARLQGIDGVTLGDMVLFAAARTLPDHPDMNAHLLEGGVVRRWRGVHLSVAVDTPRGPMAPTLFDADRKTLLELSSAAKELATAARSGGVDQDALRGGTFTVSDLSETGVEMFTPTLEPPQVCALGICGMTTRARDGVNGIETYPAMGLSLAYDHRAVDSAAVARFAQALCGRLEQFQLLLAT